MMQTQTILINKYDKEKLLSIDPRVKAQLDNAKKKVMSINQDRVFIVDGREGCHTGDTKIYTDCGILTLEQLNQLELIEYETKPKVLSVNNKKNTLEYQFYDEVKMTGKKQVYLIKTYFGLHIKSTSNHLFYLSDGTKCPVSNLLDKHIIIYNIMENVLLIDKVISIIKQGVEKVYDIINVNKNHNYIANNFLVSNSGKSLFAMQLASYLDQTFCLDDIVFSADAFAKRVKEVDKYKAVIYDESFNGLSSRSAMSSENKELVLLLQTCRQRNLFLFIVLPSIFLLDKYAAIFRSQCLFHVGISKTNCYERYYKIFNYQQKLQLYLSGKSELDYTKPRNPICYRFYGGYPKNISEDAYVAKKLDAFKNLKSKKEEGEGKYQKRFRVLLEFAIKEKKIKQSEILRWFKHNDIDFTQQNLSLIVSNATKNNKLQGTTDI